MGSSLQSSPTQLEKGVPLPPAITPQSAFAPVVTTMSDMEVDLAINAYASSPLSADPTTQSPFVII